jgi:hypothetical protein
MARKNTPSFFEAPEQTLDTISATIKSPAIFPRVTAPRIGRDDGYQSMYEDSFMPDT